MTNDGIALIYETIKSSVSKCLVLIGGGWKDVEIQKIEMANNSIKVFVYLDEDMVGSISMYKLIMTNGKIFDQRTDSISKDNSRGLLVLFEYNVKEG